MVVILIIVGVIMYIVTVIAPITIFCICDDANMKKIISIPLAIIALLVGSMCIYAISDTAVNYNEPKAIDVYRQKTTLKITYINNIPQDTIVIFK